MGCEVILSWWMACQGPEPIDTATSPEHGLVVATSDFSVGALATVDVGDRSLQDTIVATSGDTIVATDAGMVLQIDRSAPAAVRAWSPPDWSAPMVEFPLIAGSNPQDAAVCAGRLFVTLLAEPRVAVFDLDGSELDSIDLASLADGDGNPDAATLVHAGDRLFVGLQRLDTRGATWFPGGPGIVAEVDCDALAIGTTWEVGPNPSLHALSDDAIMVRTGIWGEPDGDLAVLRLDGDLEAPLLTEADLGEDVGDVAIVGGFAVAVTVPFDFSQHVVRCFDLADGARVDGLTVPNFLSAVVAGDDGLAWIAQSVDYADATSPTGLLALDPATCAATMDGPLRTLLPPYSVAVY